MTATGREWEWCAHPARERPGTAALVVAVMVALSASAGLCFGHVLAALPSLAILSVALNRFLFPSRFRIDSRGISGRYPLRRQSLLWHDVRRWTRDDRGVWLGTRAGPSRLDAYRGMHVPFGAQGREVADRIRECLRQSTASAAS